MAGKVYRVWNDIDNKSYIGKSYVGNITQYLRLLRKGRTHLKELNEDIEKYGTEHFHDEILHDNIITNSETSRLKVDEINRFDSIDNGYNLRFGGGSTGHTHESKNKISLLKRGKPLSDEHKRLIGIGNRGKRHTEDAKRKIGIGNKGKRHTEDAKRRISEGNKGRVSPNKGKKMPRHIVDRLSKARLSKAWKHQGTVCDMYVNKGMSSTEIGNLYKCSNSTILSVLKTNNIKRRKGRLSGNGKLKSAVWKHADDICILYDRSKMRSHQIADIYNTSYRTIIRILEANGIERHVGRRTLVE